MASSKAAQMADKRVVKRVAKMVDLKV